MNSDYNKTSLVRHYQFEFSCVLLVLSAYIANRFAKHDQFPFSGHFSFGNNQRLTRIYYHLYTTER